VGTYPEGSGTFQQNGSTEVPKKGRDKLWKRSRKVLMEKKKRENGPVLKLWETDGTNSIPSREVFPPGEAV
jgi:hypothetical protein